MHFQHTILTYRSVEGNNDSFRLQAVTLKIQAVQGINIGAKFSFSILYCSSKDSILD